MTKQEVINYCKCSVAIGEDDDSRYHNEVLDFIIEVLKQDPRWIPVGERLPENKQRVLVTRESGAIGYITWNTWWNEQRSYPIDKVIAWMPLPTPYKRESEDKE